MSSYPISYPVAQGVAYAPGRALLGGGAGWPVASPFENNGSGSPIGNSFPAAAYDSANDLVWIAWESAVSRLDKRVACARNYKPSTDTWSATYFVDTRTLTDDNHGTMSVGVVGGRAFLFGGNHNSATHVAVNTTANDPSAWTLPSDISGSHTFNAVTYDATKIYYFTQVQSPSAPAGTAVEAATQLFVCTPSGTAPTPAAAVTLVDAWNGNSGQGILGGGFLPISSMVDSPDGLEIYIVMPFSTFLGSAVNFTALYVLRYVKATGAVKNFDGSHSVAAASLPINLTDLNSFFKVLDTVNAGDAIAVIDADNLFHVAYAEGVPQGNSNAVMWHTFASLGVNSWSARTQMFAYPPSVAPVAVVAALTTRTAGGIRMWLPDGTAAANYSSNLGGGGAGNLIAFDRPSGGSWSGSKRILQATGTFALDYPNAVRKGPTSAKMAIAENAFDYVTNGAGGFRAYLVGEDGCRIPPVSIYDTWCGVDTRVADGVAPSTAITMTADWLTATFVSGSESIIRSMTSKTSGKRYFQAKMTKSAGSAGIAVGLSSFANVGWLGETSQGLGIWEDGSVLFNHGTVTVAAGLAAVTGANLYSYAFDLDNKLIWIRNETTSSGWNPGTANADPATGVGGYSIAAWNGSEFYIACDLETATDAVQLLAGPAKAGTPPVGWKHWTD